MKSNLYSLLAFSLLLSSNSIFSADSTNLFSRIKSWFKAPVSVSQPCQNCKNGTSSTHIDHAHSKPDHSIGQSTSSSSPVAIANFSSNNIAPELSEHALLALEKEKTKQLELANAQKLQEEHERNKWFNAMSLYHDQRNDEQQKQNHVEFFRQAHNMLSIHHQAMREIEIERGKVELEREKVRLEGLPKTLTHDLKKTEILHRHSLEKLKLIGKGVMDFTQDKERMTKATLTITGTALGIYGAKRATKVAADYVSAVLMKPALVVETSRKNLNQIILHPIKSWKQNHEILPKATYNPELQSQVDVYINSIKEGLKENLPFRHALFFGLPGTGKTLLAKKIAKELGMSYAIIPGANIHQFSEEDAIKEINKLFNWAEKSKTVLFFDECDALAPSRTSGSVSETSRKIQNTIYARTGTETNKFLILGATNEPGLLDTAFLSRLDEHLEFKLPDSKTRHDLIKLYLDKYISSDKKTEDTADHIVWVVDMTEGFSGRELSQLVRAFGANAYSAEEKKITKPIIEQVVHQKKAQRNSLKSYSSKNDNFSKTSDDYKKYFENNKEDLK